MAELMLFVLGIVLITLLARYNESNKLFWTLLVCYTLGFVGTKLAFDALRTDESKVTVDQIQPTQGLAVTQSSLLYLLADDTASASVKETSNLVGKANETVNDNPTLSCASGVTRGLYLHILPNPPNGVEIVDDS